jgi:hypothetical protein
MSERDLQIDLGARRATKLGRDLQQLDAHGRRLPCVVAYAVSGHLQPKLPLPKRHTSAVVPVALC